MNQNMLFGVLGLFLLTLALPAAALAQAPAVPPPVYVGALGAGFALTGGNTDTKTFNLTFDLVRDPKTRNVFKANALYLRADAAGETNADRLQIGVRDEYKLSDRAFVFGALPYMRDPFKNISYLLNPHGGIGYKLIATDRANLSTTGGAGVVWEKNPDIDVQTSGTVNFGQGFTYKLSEMASINQAFTALWKTSDFSDALYHTSIAMIASITQKAQVKVEFIDDYKNVTPNPLVKKNDTAFITSFIYKF